MNTFFKLMQLIQDMNYVFTEKAQQIIKEYHDIIINTIRGEVHVNQFCF